MWGKKKKLVTITIQGKLTQKQFDLIEERLYKIADKYDLGLGAIVDHGDWEGY